MAVAAHYGAFVETLADDLPSAERKPRLALEIFEGANERSAFSSGTALLAHALCDQGQYAEAEELTRQSKEAATADDAWSQIPWRSAGAKVLAHRGELDQAEAFAREAVGLAAETDLLNIHGDALLDLAEVLRLARRTGEAAEVAEHAARLYRKKGNVVSAERASPTLGAVQVNDFWHHSA
jgi:tetratricopeptide (TPR) repeat protein